MAHFAKTENGAVTQVVVVNNDVIGNALGLDGEAEGIAFCKSLFGAETQWAQTSYSGAFRGKYAGVGDKYDSDKDEFVSPEITA